MQIKHLTFATLMAVGATGLAQEPTVPVGDNLLVEGIPAIPQSVAETVRRYTEFRSAGFEDWHPTRREILVGTRFADTAQVHRVAMPMGARRQLTFFPENIAGASYQPTRGDYFVFGKDIGGNEEYQIFRYDLASGDTTQLTDKGRNEGLTWSTRGDRVLYTSTRRTGADNDLYVMDPRDPKSDRLVTQLTGGGWWPVDWSPDDRQAILAEYVSVNESHLNLLDLGTGKVTALTPRMQGSVGTSDTVAYGDAEFSQDGKGVYLTTDEGSEFSRLAYMDLRTRRITPLVTDIPWDVEEFDLSEDGRQIGFVTNEAGISVLHVFDTRTRRHRRLRSVPVGVISGLRWHANSRELGFSLSSARSPLDAHSVDVRDGKLTRWTESETGGLNAQNFVEPELVRWRSFDGREITGFLYRPPARFTGPRPVIVNIHGGPEGQSRPSFIGRTNYYLNELGVAVLYPNVRGSTGYGKTFLKLDNGILREGSYKDIGALFDWIGGQRGLDAQKVMVVGGSYGGHMAFAISYLYPERIAAAIPVVGISNIVTFLENTAAYRRDLRRVEYGDERDPKVREFLLRVAPMNNAEKITKPIFVVQGRNDPRVPFSEAQQFVDKIKGVNRNVWYLVANDEGHGFAKKKNADFQFYATVMFMRRFLLGQG